jgi:hypothetical protein
VSTVFEEDTAAAQAVDETIASGMQVARSERLLAQLEVGGDPRHVFGVDAHRAVRSRATVARASAGEAEGEGLCGRSAHTERRYRAVSPVARGARPAQRKRFGVASAR